MILPYRLGEGIWLRMTGGEVIAIVLDQCRDELGGMFYLVQADDGSRLLVTSESVRPVLNEPLVLAE